MRSFRLKPAWLLALLLWLGLIVGGYAWLLRYSFAAGKASASPPAIPSSVASPAPSARAQLFLALHPRCPCSRATLSELAKILSRAPEACDVTVLMYKPEGEPDSWMAGALLDNCRRMSCRVRPDADGRLAGSLGSFTSGGVVLYDAKGRLRYQGGITASRAHEGDNAGKQAVIAILRGHHDSQKPMPVFGCPIQPNPTERYPL